MYIELSVPWSCIYVKFVNNFVRRNTIQPHEFFFKKIKFENWKILNHEIYNFYLVIKNKKYIKKKNLK